MLLGLSELTVGAGGPGGGGLFDPPEPPHARRRAQHKAVQAASAVLAGLLPTWLLHSSKYEPRCDMALPWFSRGEYAHAWVLGASYTKARLPRHRSVSGPRYPAC